MKIFVTGSEGLIGKAFCRMSDDEQVTRFDKALDAKMDILNIDSIDKAIIASEPDLIVHLAAQSGVEEARADASAAWRLNLLGTLNVLDVAMLYKVPVLAASSNHVYGTQDTYPTPESSPMNQLDTYSATKIACDVLVRSYWHNYGLPTAVIRNTNCYGPASPHIHHIVETAILHAMDGRDLQLRTDGTIKKGYLYVDDAANAYRVVGKALVNGDVSGQAFNASTDSISAMELARKIYKMMGNSTNSVWAGPPFYDQMDEYLDSYKLHGLGWKPIYTLEEGLKLTIEGFKTR